MSTNYYLITPDIPPVAAPAMRLPCGITIKANVQWPDDDDPRIHVALFAARRWAWAQSPDFVRGLCAAYPKTEIIRDEYGARYTGLGFLELLKKSESHDLSMIGKRFS